MNSTPAFSRARRMAMTLSSRGSRLSISNSATVDNATPEDSANRVCDHFRSARAARHCCEFMLDCNASRYAELVICSRKGDKQTFKNAEFSYVKVSRFY